MKGILEKTTRGWVVKVLAAEGPDARFVRTYPLHESDASNMDEAVRLGEHGEVEFELVMGIDSIFNTTKPFAKIVYPMLDRLKAHLETITPEQFDAEIDDIIKNDTSVMLVHDECGMELANCKCVDWITCEMEDCPHCAYEEQERYEADLEKEAAIDFAKWIAKEWMSMWVVDKWLWENVSVDTNEQSNWTGYYTEEQLYELYLKETK